MAIFIDTGYILALINTSDEYHDKAKQIISEIKGPFVTSDAILTEIANSLSRIRWRSLCISTLQDLRRDPDIKIITITAELFDKAIII
jgi:predicted nucleic acid-binding protein